MAKRSYPAHVKDLDRDRASPGYILGAFGTGPADSGQGYHGATSAMKVAYEAIVHSWRAAWRYDVHLAGDKTKLPEQRLVQSARYARDRASEVRAKYAEALEQGAREAAGLRTKLSEAMPYRPIDEEIRRYAQGLSLEERQRFMTEADWQTRKAIAAGPGYLSGLQPEVHQRIRREYLSEVMPEESAKLAALEAATDALQQAMAGYEDHHGALLDWGEVDLLERGAKEPEAA